MKRFVIYTQIPQYFQPLLLVFLAVLLFLYATEKNAIIEVIQSKERNKVEHGIDSILKEISAKKSDLLFLHDLLEHKQGLDDTIDKNDILAQEYMSYITRKKEYDQIGIIDKNGKEIIRINYNEGKPYRVSENEFQQKEDMYYFKETIELNRGEIYISPLDLNIENNEIEQPIKPMIRFGTPIFDSSGQKNGILIINYFGKNSIDDFKKTAQNEYGQAELLNSEGFWLSSVKPENEWGFMYPEKNHINYGKTYKKQWELISSSGGGQTMVDEGLLTFQTVYMFQQNSHLNLEKQTDDNTEISTSGSEEYCWKVVSLVPIDILKNKYREIGIRLIALTFFIVVFLLIASYFLAKERLRLMQSKKRLEKEALYDSVTGLPNRNFFNKQLKQLLRESMLKGIWLVLMFIDLDGFKEINDKFGHDSGDLLLKEAGSRMCNCLRQTDVVVSRVGGDEFTIILPDIKSRDKIEEIAQRILDVLSQPFELQGKLSNIGASIGISIYPYDGDTSGMLVQKADSAMYYVKANGKNNYKIFDSIDV